MLINTNFSCTYHLIKENYEDSLMLYKIQFLQIFNLEEYNDDLVNKKVYELYEILKDNEIIKNLIEKNNIGITDENDNDDNDDNNDNNDNNDNKLIKFMLYFRYDTMYIFHKIISKILENKDKEEYSHLYDNLIKII